MTAPTHPGLASPDRPTAHLTGSALRAPGAHLDGDPEVERLATIIRFAVPLVLPVVWVGREIIRAVGHFGW